MLEEPERIRRLGERDEDRRVRDHVQLVGEVAAPISGRPLDTVYSLAMAAKMAPTPRPKRGSTFVGLMKKQKAIAADPEREEELAK